MKKKLFLGLGTIASVAAPIVAVVSCGDEVVNGKMSWNRSNKEVIFNLNSTPDKGAFEAYGLDFDGLKALDADFAAVITQNNILKLEEGEMVTAKFVLALTEEKAAGGDSSVTTKVEHKVTLKIKFAYHAKMDQSILAAVEYKGFKSNITAALAKALTTNAFGTGAGALANAYVASANDKVGHFEMKAYGTAGVTEANWKALEKVAAADKAIEIKL